MFKPTADLEEAIKLEDFHKPTEFYKPELMELEKGNFHN